MNIPNILSQLQGKFSDLESQTVKAMALSSNYETRHRLIKTVVGSDELTGKEAIEIINKVRKILDTDRDILFTELVTIINESVRRGIIKEN